MKKTVKELTVLRRKEVIEEVNVEMQDTRKIILFFDCDKTLIKKDMQEYGLIAALGESSKEFWTKANDYVPETKENNRAPKKVLSYPYYIVSKNHNLTRKQLALYGKNFEYFPNVIDAFRTWKNEAESYGIELKIIIVSSGNKEILEGSALNDVVDGIYACEFRYDENGYACGVKELVDEDAKPVIIQNIAEENNVNLSDCIYVGDSATDIKAFKCLQENGGCAIGVYEHDTTKIKEVCRKAEVELDYIFPSDYSDGQAINAFIGEFIESFRTNVLCA